MIEPNDPVIPDALLGYYDRTLAAGARRPFWM
jgi:hypothetical protein